MAYFVLNYSNHELAPFFILVTTYQVSFQRLLQFIPGTFQHEELITLLKHLKLSLSAFVGQKLQSKEVWRIVAGAFSGAEVFDPGHVQGFFLGCLTGVSSTGHIFLSICSALCVAVLTLTVWNNVQTRCVCQVLRGELPNISEERHSNFSSKTYKYEDWENMFILFS